MIASDAIPDGHPNKPWATPEYIGQQMQNRFKLFAFLQIVFSADAAIAVVNERGIPVLALLGDADEIIELSQQQTYAETLPRAQFNIVPAGGHDLQNTASADFVTLVEKFVADSPA